jgi:hypothetical protein
MKKIKILLISLFTISAFFYSCKKDKTDTNSSLKEKTFVVNATSDTKWVYFSFDKNDTVQITDPKNSSDWDLAFKRFYIRSNSGLSGIGSAGADSTNLKNQNGFDTYKTLNDTAKFITDKNMQVMTYMGYGMDTVNPVLYTWFNYNFATNQLIPTNMIYVVKTATGKYAKVWIESYYNEMDLTSGYIKFIYTYQPDGSKNLQ